MKVVENSQEPLKMKIDKRIIFPYICVFEVVFLNYLIIPRKRPARVAESPRDKTAVICNITRQFSVVCFGLTFKHFKL